VIPLGSICPQSLSHPTLITVHLRRRVHADYRKADSKNEQGRIIRERNLHIVRSTAPLDMQTLYVAAVQLRGENLDRHVVNLPSTASQM